jgi:hypothetical protein
MWISCYKREGLFLLSREIGWHIVIRYLGFARRSLCLVISSMSVLGPRDPSPMLFPLGSRLHC